jgi:hypothetical protein
MYIYGEKERTKMEGRKEGRQAGRQAGTRDEDEGRRKAERELTEERHKRDRLDYLIRKCACKCTYMESPAMAGSDRKAVDFDDIAEEAEKERANEDGRKEGRKRRKEEERLSAN